jgi:hypothetical protein
MDQTYSGFYLALLPVPWNNDPLLARRIRAYSMLHTQILALSERMTVERTSSMDTVVYASTSSARGSAHARDENLRGRIRGESDPDQRGGLVPQNQRQRNTNFRMSNSRL